MDFLFLHWLRPAWLLALFPVLALLLPLSLSALGQNPWRKVCDPHLLPHLLMANQTSSRKSPKILILIGFLLCIIALAGPSVQSLKVPVFKLNTARVIVFDLSNAQSATDIKPNRLTRARFKALDLLNALQEGQTGLLAFSQYPFVVSPLTADTQTLVNQIPELSPEIMPTQGYDLSAALLKAKTLIQAGGAKRGDIVVFTAQSPHPKDLDTAKTLAKQGFRIDVLPIGSSAQSSIRAADGSLLKDSSGNIIVTQWDPAALSALARAGHGQLWSLDTPISQMVSILNPHNAQQSRDSSQAQTRLWVDQGYYLIWLLLILVLGAFRKGRLQELFK